MPQVCCTVAAAVIGIDTDVRRLAGSLVVTRQVTEIFAGIHNIGIVRIRDGKSGFTAADRFPVACEDTAG